METSKNLAAQIVDNACQEFQQLVSQQEVLAPMAQKAAKRAIICKWLSIISAILLIILLVAYLILDMNGIITKHSLFAVVFGPIIVMLVAVLLLSYFDNKHRLYQQKIKIVADSRSNYVKSVISRALIEHMCANEDDNTADFYFNRMKEITGGFFADDFSSSLTKEETAEIKSWLKASYAACLQTA